MNYIIDFIDTMTDAGVLNYAATNNITIIKQFHAFGQVYLASCETEPAIDESLLSVVLDNDNVVNLLSFNVDLTETLDHADVAIDDTQNWWKVASIEGIEFDDPVNSIPLRGGTSKVYVVDSGIEIDHPEFAGKSIELLHSFTDDFVDTAGHGTAIASVIAGNTCSITNTDVKVVKIFDNNVATTQGDLLGAFNAILQDYEGSAKRYSIVNLSWSIPRNDYVNSKIQVMLDRGLIVIAASGNNGLPIQDVTPACVPDVITVGSFNQALLPSDFSAYTDPTIITNTADTNNYGEIDGWAPGEQIWVAGLNGTYGYSAGTSMSAGIISAASAYNVALYLDIPSEDYGAYANSAHLNNNRLRGIKASVFKREGLLQLEGKYTNSVNKIGTYNMAARSINSATFCAVQAGTPYIGHIASPTEFSKISSQTDLPNWVNITTTGHIYINYSEITESFILIPEIYLTVTKADGTEMDTKLIIIIYHQDKGYHELIEEEMASDNDSPLIIALLVDSCAWESTIECTGGCDADPKELCNYVSAKTCDCVP